MLAAMALIEKSTADDAFVPSARLAGHGRHRAALLHLRSGRREHVAIGLWRKRIPVTPSSKLDEALRPDLHFLLRHQGALLHLLRAGPE
jgi:hypothetical protein